MNQRLERWIVLTKQAFPYVLSVAIGVVGGVAWASHTAVTEAENTSAEAPKSIATDLRHPAEVFMAPPFYQTIPEMLTALHLTVEPEDRIQITPLASFGVGGQLVIERSQAVTLHDGGEQTTYHTWSNTVGDLLTERRVEVGDQDRIEPAKDKALDLNQEITITRVSVTDVEKTEPIKFTTKTETDPNRPRGETKTTQKGKNGTKKLTYRVTRENGKEVKRVLTKTEVTEEAQPEIISVGTRVISLGQGKATWYDPPWSGLTAAHNTLPKGTMVEVVSVATGKRVTVKINDRGIQSDAVIDLSPEAFKELGPLGAGVLQVKLEIPG